jgi:AraC family transcriptional regulator
MTTPIDDSTEAEERRVQLAMRAMVLIQRDLSAEISVEGLAQELGVSWSTLSHVFPGVVGETLWQHVKRLRLERSAFNLLASRTASVLDIAVASGFASQAAFSRAFKEAYGCAPTRFRNRPDAHPLLPSPSGVHIVRGGGLARFKPVPWLSDRLTVRIESRPPVHLAFVRGRGEYDITFFAHMLVRMLTAARRRGLLQPAARLYGVMHEDPFVASTGQITYDACISVPTDFVPAGSLGSMTLPEGTWACVECEGPAEQHFASWHTFGFQWLPDQPWAMSHAMVVNQYHFAGELLSHQESLIEALLRGFSATEMIPVRPGPRGALLPV